MAVIVADSDVLIDFLRRTEPIASEIGSAIEAGRLATTVINAFELLSGARSRRHLRDIEKLLEAIDVRSIGRRAADTAAKGYRELREKAITVPFADCLIAGVCVSAGLPLLTRNKKHFADFPSLVLVPIAGP